MKQITILLLAILLACKQNEDIVRAPTGLILRAEPSTRSKSLGVLPFKSSVQILQTGPMEQIFGITAPWQEVKTSTNAKAWVFGGFLHRKGICTCDFTSNYVATEYNGSCKLPNSLTSRGGNIVGTEHGLAEFDRTSQRIIWFEFQIDRINDGPCWVVTDTLTILNSDLVSPLSLMRSECSFDKTPDAEIIAVVTWEPNEAIFRKIRSAWRADRKTGKILPVDPSRVECHPPCVGAGCI